MLSTIFNHKNYDKNHKRKRNFKNLFPKNSATPGFEPGKIVKTLMSRIL